MSSFHDNGNKIEAARAFSVFVGQTEASVGIFPTLDFRNFGSLAVGQTNVPLGTEYKDGCIAGRRWIAAKPGIISLLEMVDGTEKNKKEIKIRPGSVLRECEHRKEGEKDEMLARWMD